MPNDKKSIVITYLYKHILANIVFRDQTQYLSSLQGFMTAPAPSLQQTQFCSSSPLYKAFDIILEPGEKIKV